MNCLNKLLKHLKLTVFIRFFGKALCKTDLKVFLHETFILEQSTFNRNAEKLGLIV